MTLYCTFIFAFVKHKIMKKTILSILLIAFVGFAFAENEENNESKTASESAKTISLSGHVVDMITGEALTGVEISVDGSDIKAYSDFDGNFTLNNLKPGEYNLVASFISYKKSLVENYKTGVNQEVNIKLQAD